MIPPTVDPLFPPHCPTHHLTAAFHAQPAISSPHTAVWRWHTLCAWWWARTCRDSIPSPVDGRTAHTARRHGSSCYRTVPAVPPYRFRPHYLVHWLACPSIPWALTTFACGRRAVCVVAVFPSTFIPYFSLRHCFCHLYRHTLPAAFCCRQDVTFTAPLFCLLQVMPVYASYSRIA